MVAARVTCILQLRIQTLINFNLVAEQYGADLIGPSAEDNMRCSH